MSKTLVPNLMLAPDVARPNLLQNGGFEQWHRGPGPFAATTGNPTFAIADQWQTICTGSGSTLTVSRDSVNQDTGLYCVAMVNSIAGGGGYGGIQQTPPAAPLRGKTVTLSLRVKTTQANVVIFAWTDGTGGTFSPTMIAPADGAYHTLWMTFSIPLNTNNISVGLQCQGSTAGTTYVDSASLVIGQVAENFFPATSYPDALPNERIASDLLRPNYLTNGGFEIWQRGTGPFTGNYCADRWLLGVNGSDTLSVSRATGNNADYGVTGSNYSAGVTYTKGSGNSSAVLQYLKQADAFQLAGRTVTLSMRVLCSVANMVRVGLDTDAGGGGIYNTPSPRSLYHSGDGTWQTLSVTVSLGACSYVAASAYFDTNSGVAYIDSAMLTIGTVASDFVPLHPADDLARCWRYYEIIGYPSQVQTELALGAVYSTTTAAFQIHYIPKPIVPTVTIVGSPQITNSGGAVVAVTGGSANYTSPNSSVFLLSCGGGLVAGNSSRLVGTAAQQYITIEANP